MFRLLIRLTFWLGHLQVRLKRHALGGRWYAPLALTAWAVVRPAGYAAWYLAVLSQAKDV